MERGDLGRLTISLKILQLCVVPRETIHTERSSVLGNTRNAAIFIA